MAGLSQIPQRRATDPRVDHIETRLDSLALEVEEGLADTKMRQEGLHREIGELKAMMRPVMETGALPACKIEAVRFEQMRDDINRLQHAVFGNGKPGIEKTILALEAYLKRLEIDLIRHDEQQTQRETDAKTAKKQDEVDRKALERERRGYLFAIVMLVLSDIVLKVIVP